VKAIFKEIMPKVAKFVQTEKSIQNAIADVLVRAGWLVVRMNSGATSYSGKDKKKRFVRFYTIWNNKKSYGLSDLLAFKNNAYLIVEVKNKKGRLSENQKIFLELAKSKKVKVHVMRSVDEIIIYLKERGELL